ncbi:MAG: hypothetical protein HXY20_10650 [Acidobacteria bacterium]|nr:hypothetical protein [Acidobacteriota bacterium]
MRARLLVFMGYLIASVFPCLAQMISQPGLPVEIGDASLDMSATTKEAYLQFMVTNFARDPLRRIGMGVLVRNRQDHPIAFQIAPFEVNIAPGSCETVRLRLGNQLYVEDRLFNFTSAVTEVQTDSEAWQQTLSPLQLALALKRADPIPIAAAPTATALASQCPGLCWDCRQMAACICGQQTGCVKDFKCSLSTCECSFTCNSQPGCTPPSGCP